MGILTGNRPKTKGDGSTNEENGSLHPEEICCNRIFFPYYKDYKIYLGLASMSFNPDVEEECITQGIAIIKQLGDTVVIYDEHLKIWR